MSHASDNRFFRNKRCRYGSASWRRAPIRVCVTYEPTIQIAFRQCDTAGIYVFLLPGRDRSCNDPVARAGVALASALLFYIDGCMGYWLRRGYLLDETLSTTVFLPGFRTHRLEHCPFTLFTSNALIFCFTRFHERRLVWPRPDKRRSTSQTSAL